MPTYIDKDPIVEECASALKYLRAHVDEFDPGEWKSLFTAVGTLQTKLLFAPVVDATQVVRCGNCKHWNTISERDKAVSGFCRKAWMLGTYKRDWFCADGEEIDG